MIEVELAKELASATVEDRERLYGSVYDRIYLMHLGRAPDILEFGARTELLSPILRHTRRGSQVLEIGCGTGLLAVGLARAGRQVTAIDVSEVALDRARMRELEEGSVDFKRVEGVDLPFPDHTFEFAYSIEVLEHLHEDDARRHLAEVCRVLKPAGRYWFLTPNRHMSVGPGQRFGVAMNPAADVHLKEWTYGELRDALHDAGFDGAAVPLGTASRLRSRVKMPIGVAAALDSALRPGPRATRLRREFGLEGCCVWAKSPDGPSPS